MTDRELLELAAKAAGIPDGYWNCEATGEDDNSKNISAQIQHFAAIVAAAEREACAKTCMETEPFYGAMFAEAIRAKGPK